MSGQRNHKRAREPLVVECAGSASQVDSHRLVACGLRGLARFETASVSAPNVMEVDSPSLAAQPTVQIAADFAEPVTDDASWLSQHLKKVTCERVSQCSKRRSCASPRSSRSPVTAARARHRSCWPAYEAGRVRHVEPHAKRDPSDTMPCASGILALDPRPDREGSALVGQQVHGADVGGEHGTH